MAELLTYTCPCCGGALKFDSTLQKVKCQFCDTEYEVQDLKAYDESLNQNVEENTKWDLTGDEFKESDNLSIYSCKTCGGEVICDENTTSTLCPYCGNPLLFTGRLSGGLKPRYVIPFKLEKEDARNNLNKYFKGKLLLPSDFRKENEVKEITSLYVPYWIFDADVYGYTSFRAKKIRHYSDSKYNYTEERFYKIIRNGRVAFEHLPVDASRKMDDQMMESIEPFNFNEAKDFSQAYIVGYPADKYDVSMEESFDRANQRIKEGTVDAFRSTIHGYDSVSTETASINYLSNSASYALYPIWTLNSEYKDKKYQFAMNAQTGKLVGNLPISALKFTLWLIFSFLISGALIGLIFGAILKEAPKGIIIGVIAGAIISTIIMIALYRKMKAVRFQHGAYNYLVQNSLNIEYARDIFLYRHVTKVAKPQSNNRR